MIQYIAMGNAHTDTASMNVPKKKSSILCCKKQNALVIVFVTLL